MPRIPVCRGDNIIVSFGSCTDNLCGFTVFTVDTTINGRLSSSVDGELLPGESSTGFTVGIKPALRFEGEPEASGFGDEDNPISPAKKMGPPQPMCGLFDNEMEVWSWYKIMSGCPPPAPLDPYDYQMRIGTDKYALDGWTFLSPNGPLGEPTNRCDHFLSVIQVNTAFNNSETNIFGWDWYQSCLPAIYDFWVLPGASAYINFSGSHTEATDPLWYHQTKWIVIRVQPFLNGNKCYEYYPNPESITGWTEREVVLEGTMITPAAGTYFLCPKSWAPWQHEMTIESSPVGNSPIRWQ